MCRSVPTPLDVFVPGCGTHYATLLPIRRYSQCSLQDAGSTNYARKTSNLLLVQCLHYKILPSGLCAEICYNRGKKGLSGRIETFSGPLLEQIGTFYRYLHQHAELLKIMRKHDNPISRSEKVHRDSAANIHIFQFEAPGFFFIFHWGFLTVWDLYTVLL